MAQSNKITLSQACGIPFNKLTLSQHNVRKIKAGVSVDELAEDIARRGLLQSLNVRAVLDEEGAETGMFEVPAGGRRFQALALLVEQKRLNKTAPVPCIVRDPADGISAEDDSLAENTQRAPLHPLDQFRAFVSLREQGMGDEEIAAAFFVTTQVVKQRLKLTTVAPELLEAYGEDDMTLDQLMAFTVSSDPTRQIEVWETIKDSWNKEPHAIRRMLTEGAVRAGDRRALFVGERAYEAAGGVILRDLFDENHSGYWQDAALLDRLVLEKLKGIANEAAAEGWKWVAANTDYPYGHTRDYRRVPGIEHPLNEEEQTRKAALLEELQTIENQYADADEYPDDAYDRMEEIEEDLNALANRPLQYSDAEKGQSGVFLSIDHDGTLKRDRGWVRPEDDLGSSGGGTTGIETEGGTAPTTSSVTVGDPEEETTDVIKPLPEKLVSELTAFRTLALRDAVAQNPQLALTALLFKLVTDQFGSRTMSGSCLGVEVREAHFPNQGPDLPESSAALSIEQRQAGWVAEMPEDQKARWDWIDSLPQDKRLELLAHCVSFGVNALLERPNPYSGMGISQSGLDRRLAQADHLATVTGLDLVASGWKPTADNYLNRVPKIRIIEAVREGAGEQAAQLIDHLKKGDMASEAERLLEDSGWLPEPLRMVGVTAANADDVELPAFLGGDVEVDPEDVAIAAE